MTLGIALATGLLLPRALGQAGGPLLPVAEIKDGMKGYGLTVFKGTEPERFDVEVVGVLHNFKPGQELILIKTPHPRLNVTKAVRGMSGSPIFLNGRLAGAYAYNWASFSAEPIAGVTPIGLMMTELARPIPAGFWPLEGMGPLPGSKPNTPAPRADAGATRFEGAPGTYDLEAHAAQVHARLSRDTSQGPQPVATPLMLGGMSDHATQLANRLFAPLGFETMQAGGGSGKADGAPLHYVDGGAVGVELVKGDVSFMGLGTVTHVVGQKLCAFGHPMMSMGNASLPAAIGRIHWIFASEQASVKIGEAARSLGTMVQDRPSAIVVDETVAAPTFPMSVKIEGVTGAPRDKWSMVVAQERFMTAGLLASALGSVVESTVSERRDVTWRLNSRLTVKGRGAVDLEDFGVAIGGTPDQEDWVRSRLARLVGDVLNNPWENVHIDKVEATMSVQYTRDLWRLRGVEAEATEVVAGEKLRLRVHLVPTYGSEVVKVIEVPAPLESAGREMEVELAPGYEVQPDVAAPERLADLLANATRQTAPPRSLVASVRLPYLGVAYRGHVAQKLPPFALDALRPQASDVAPEAFPAFARTVVPTERFVEGRTKVKVKVRAPQR
jgi:hypothetical protein